LSKLLVLVAVAFLLWRLVRAWLATAPGVRASRDPWTVLGVAPDADRDAIAQAYRDQQKLYHPDRVAGLGDELQALAHEKTLEIQQAYEALTRS
jgi:DnaJ-domain-containing protein 1